MSQKVQCERCGGEDFRLESGFYFCSECQLQSQDIQEHVLDEFYAGAAMQSRKLKKTEDENESRSLPGPSEDKKKISSVEVLNYILKGLVDELIMLGAPKKLKVITIQLWASYLRKIEMAFTSTSVQKKPKFGIWYRQGDVARFYKVRKQLSIRDYPRLIRKKRREQSKKSVSSGASSKSHSIRSKKLKLSASKAALARAEYDESCVDGSLNLSSQAPSFSSLDLSQVSQSSYPSSGERIRFTKQAKEDFRRFVKQIDMEENKIEGHKKMVLGFQRSLQYPRLKHLVSILRIALILSGSGIHIGDLLRWSDEGYFSYNCMRKLIPPEISLSAEQQILFLSPPIEITNICWSTVHMVKFLSVSNVGISPSKLISDLVKRYCIILNLPDNVSCGIDEMLKLKPPKVWLDSGTSNYEGRAMALIIFSLKILIGLDDVTEYNYVPRKDVEGVKWEEWCRQYEARMAERALHHYPTLVRHYPNSYVGRNHSFLSHWDPTLTSSVNPQRYNNSTETRMLESFQRVLKPLACKVPEPTWRPGLEHEVKRSGPPLAVLSECIDGSVRKGERRIILEPPCIREKKDEKMKVKPKSAMDLNVRILNDDAEVKIKSTLINSKPASEGVKIVTGNEDYSVWMYRSKDCVGCKGLKAFCRTMAGKMPHSFWWLLKQTAEIVHQSPLNIYQELVKVEAVHSKKKNINVFRIW